METDYSNMSNGELLDEARSAIADLPADYAGRLRPIVDDVETTVAIGQELPTEHAQRVGPIFDALFERVATVWNVDGGTTRS